VLQKRQGFGGAPAPGGARPRVRVDACGRGERLPLSLGGVEARRFIRLIGQLRSPLQVLPLRNAASGSLLWPEAFEYTPEGHLLEERECLCDNGRELVFGKWCRPNNADCRWAKQGELDQGAE